MDKQYKIIDKIGEDAPFGDINWCSISFLNPQKIEKINYLDMKGFKIYNGYNNFESATNDVNRIKSIKKDFDIYVANIGKLYAWDDATKAEQIEYEDDKLNELEKTRKENIDKVKLMSEQFKNEFKKHNEDFNAERKKKQIEKLRNKLLSKGLITKKEMEIIDEEMKACEINQKKITDNPSLINEVEECWKTDYLDESVESAFKYGCISIYSSKYIAGLKDTCFKIRGLFETMPEVEKRIKKLKQLNPDDRIYTFMVGKWCPYTELDIEEDKQLKFLNFIMKNHLDNIDVEKKEFEKRKEIMQKQTPKKPKKEKNKTKNIPEVPNIPTMKPEDNDNIEKIYNFLDDPELTNKFKIDTDALEKVEINLNKN